MLSHRGALQIGEHHKNIKGPLSCKAFSEYKLFTLGYLRAIRRRSPPREKYLNVAVAEGNDRDRGMSLYMSRGEMHSKKYLRRSTVLCYTEAISSPSELRSLSDHPRAKARLGDNGNKLR